MDKLTEEQQKTWDVLNTPAIESTDGKVKRIVGKIAGNYVGQPNDDITRGALMHDINGALETLTEQKQIIDYKVVCDVSNNSPDVIDNNQLYCNVYIRPARTVNFLNLTIIVGDQ